MKVLALDLGTRCGWALFNDGAPLASGTWELSNARQRRFEGGGVKWLRLRGLLNQAVLGQLVEKIVFEEVRSHAGVDAAHAYGGALAVLTAFCEAEGIPYEAYPVGTIKKHATGKGNAKKDAMIEAARARWPAIAIEDDNHADALWIGDLASRK
jgi:hypothetical protein